MAIRPPRRRATSGAQGRSRDKTGNGSVRPASRKPLDFRHLFVHSPDPQLIVDDDGRITAVNSEACRLSGFQGDELLAMNLAEMVTTVGAPTIREGINRAVEFGPSSCCGLTLIRKDGQFRLTNVFFTRLHNRSFLVTFRDPPDRRDGARDVTEQQAMFETLNDALQKLQFQVRCMPLAYIVWDGDYRVTEWNPAAEKLFGFTKSEALGMHALDLVPPEHRAYAEEKMAETLRGESTVHALSESIRKDGFRITCEWFGSALRDSTGRIHGVASIAWDVSQREELEARIRNAQRIESLGVLASGVAHDFNSSLMVMLGHASLLRAVRGLPPQAVEHLDAIEQAGQSAGRFIKHLLAYARTGRHNPQPTNLNDVIHDGLALLQSSMGARHSLRLSLAENLPLVLADRSQIEQIIFNLCLNAKQAMTGGGEIELSTRPRSLAEADLAGCVPYDAKPGPFVELSVRDAGCGMDTATISRIFDPFFTTKADGHGLGLAAVLGILRQHHGAAKVESAPGRGTTIRIFIPVSRPKTST